MKSHNLGDPCRNNTPENTQSIWDEQLSSCHLPWNWGLISQLWEAKPPKTWPLVSFTSNTVEPWFLQFPTMRVKLSPCTLVENNSLQGAACPAGSWGLKNMRSGKSSTQRSSDQGASRHWGSKVGGEREVNSTLRPSPIRSSRKADTPETRNSQSSRQATLHLFWSTWLKIGNQSDKICQCT